eukprot:TRINITY_DN1378_c0_g1_i1.p1 TRINITY_DN1378_c0_g1~~TRINITY_DN1378_c0_g1_i1.p1  ORF type:complete len:530 (-),score=92.39 TRINITY_DN1378_c0_g1_i1:222-1811(-)
MCIRDRSTQSTGSEPSAMSMQGSHVLLRDDLGVHTHITTREPTSKYRDLPWAAGFLANLVVIVTLAISFKRPLNDLDADDAKYLDNSVLAGVAVSILASVCFAVAWFFMIMKCAKQLIWAGLIFSVVLMGAGAVYAFSVGSVYTALFFVLLCGLQVAYCYCVRHRIQLAVMMTEISTEVGRIFPGMFVVSAAWIVVNLLTIGVWLLSAAFTLYEFNTVRQSSSGAMYGLGCYFLLSLYWIGYVNMYIVHCTSAGVFGHWYFKVTDADPSTKQTSPTLPALQRATSSSFGSVCLGGLIIATIELLNALARQAQRDADNGIVAFVACCIRCVLECIGDIVRFINRYAFTICAIYGDSYCESVSLTMDVLKQNGFEAIINDDLVSTFLGMGSLFGSLLAAAIGAGAAKSAGADNDQLVAVVITGFLMGLSIIGVVSSAIISCVTSFWVCFALDPTELFNTKHEHYTRLMEALNTRWGGQCEVPCYEYVSSNCEPCTTASRPTIVPQPPSAPQQHPDNKDYRAPPKYNEWGQP